MTPVSTNPMDRQARKQVLRTRIAFERATLRSEIAHVSAAARLPNLLRAVIGGRFGRSLLGVAGPAVPGGWIGLALSLLRRYRVAAALLGGAAPLLRGRGGWRRLARIAALAAAAYVGWRFARRRDSPQR